jgi:molybdopterin synthase catalytic subunit
MIDFTAKQLSWILITACGVGGGGYLTMDGKVREIDNKMTVANVRQEAMNQRMTEVLKQLERIEEKIDRKNYNK